MPTKLRRYAEGVMEAAWLAALVVVPLFFNIYSSRIFEPDKISLMRSLALVILGAWLVKLFDEGRLRWEKVPQGETWLKTLWQIPLLAPVAAMAGVYLLATVLSVAPRISLFGSYQRLQGLYSTFSYLVIFGALVANLRQRAQVDRLITTAILVSLPISMYGVLQRFEIDPVPWAGNVTIRIAANMGNAIFVAAYLIMVTPLTIGRIVDSFSAILKEDSNSLWGDFARATVYVFIAALQLIAIYLSRSRGPLLGLLAGGFFLFILLSLLWRKRWMTFGVVGAAAAVGVFLILLNVPGGPLEGIRSSPWIGRLGQVFDMDQRTSRVRVLIWGGAADLVAPHEPLDFPDGSVDTLNFLRPLIGYGPESMHVAYNKFFPAELAGLEKRNASPDRSHNETWDALVTTGILGLAAYLVLFASVFYYGLKWLGMLTTPRQGLLLLLLYFGGGLATAIGFALVLGIEFFGVGLPFGAILGLTFYLTLVALTGSLDLPTTEGGQARALILIFLLGAIVAHFVEINFGIAIVATRTYFWIFTALLLLVGYILPLHGEFSDFGHASQANHANGEPPAEETSNRRLRRKRRRGERVSGAARSRQPWLQGALQGGLISALILGTLGYDFISVQTLPLSPVGAIWTSFTNLPNREATSFGVLAMLLVVWMAAGILFFTEAQTADDAKDWRGFITSLGLSAVVAFLFWLWHAGSLIFIALTISGGQLDIISQASLFEGLLTRYNFFFLLLILVAASQLPTEWPTRLLGRSGLGALVAPAALVVVIVLSVFTNLRIIQADITFKLADPLAKNGQWDAAIALYDRSNQFAFAEDYYYLFLGKAYLDSASAITNTVQQDKQVERAETSLERAQTINPLNTDHTANLARLYRWWASRANDNVLRRERGQISSDYYDRALTLSPNNAALWGEWGSLYLGVLRQPEEAYGKLSKALEIDPDFETTHALLGDYYIRISQGEVTEEEKTAALEQATYHYSQAVELIQATTNQARQAKYNYIVAAGGAYVELGNREAAIDMYRQAIDDAPARAEIWRVEEVIASLYLQLGDRDNALAFASSAVVKAPDAEKGRLQNLVIQLQASP